MENKNENTTLLPKISVIMPVYNTAKYLCEALNSICNQSLKELEIIIVNFNKFYRTNVCLYVDYSERLLYNDKR